MRATFRFVLAAAAAATLPAVAAQGQQDTTRTGRRAAADSSRAGERGKPETRYRVHPRDLIGADSDVCDDLCRRERMMDSVYGRDRERMPAAARRPAARPDTTARRP